MTRTLVITNDFPPRQGGIQTFVAALLARRPPDSVVVLASDSPGSKEYDAALPYPVVRRPTAMLLPTRATARGSPAATMVSFAVAASSGRPKTVAAT